MTNWKDKLDGQIPEAWNEEIDVFAQQMELRRQGLLADKIFAETRLDAALRPALRQWKAKRWSQGPSIDVPVW